MLRILIVEDNEMSRDILVRRLTKAGFEVIEAINGEEALEKAGDKHPHLILMDMNLPVMDGWEATRRLKASDTTKAIPVIALTAHAMVEDLRSTIEAGCDDYDTKPIDFTRLLQKVHHFLGEENGADPHR
jgi:two-component system, cell cycle response regulator DivK